MEAQAVIFDLDGTLIDTEASWDEVRRGMAAEAGVPWPEGATQAMMGMSTPEWAHYMVTAVGFPMSDEETARVTIEAMAGLHARGVRRLPDAVESVLRMAERYRVGVASSSPRVLIDEAVRALGLDEVFCATVSTEEVERGKPAPDGYLRAAELMGVAPTACVAVEDSANGIRSALAAGMRVVVVPPHFHPPSADVLAQTRVLDSLEGLTFDVIASL